MTHHLFLYADGTSIFCGDIDIYSGKGSTWFRYNSLGQWVESWDKSYKSVLMLFSRNKYPLQPLLDGQAIAFAPS